MDRWVVGGRIGDNFHRNPFPSKACPVMGPNDSGILVHRQEFETKWISGKARRLWTNKGPNAKGQDVDVWRDHREFEWCRREWKQWPQQPDLAWHYAPCQELDFQTRKRTQGKRSWQTKWSGCELSYGKHKTIEFLLPKQTLNNLPEKRHGSIIVNSCLVVRPIVSCRGFGQRILLRTPWAAWRWSRWFVNLSLMFNVIWWIVGIED